MYRLETPQRDRLGESVWIGETAGFVISRQFNDQKSQPLTIIFLKIRKINLILEEKILVYLSEH